MKTSIWLIVKIELIKFFKRNDLIAVLGIVAIGFIYALSMRGNSYTGVENQNALFWVTAELLTTTVLFICPVIMSFVGTQMLSTEIENNSISLFNVRVRNREKMYYGKSIALIIICTLFFFLSIGALFVIYFLIANNDTIYVSGTVTGNNARELICILFLIYMYSFFFIPQMSFCLGVKFKPLVTIVLTFCVTLFCNNVATYSVIRYFNPMQYVVRLADDVASTTEMLFISGEERMFCVLAQIILCGVYFFIFNLCGVKAFGEKDL